MTETNKLTRVQAIMRYFNDPEGEQGIPSAKPTLPEMKALSREERDELAEMAAKELSLELS